MDDKIKQRIKEAIIKSPQSMAFAAKLSGMPYRTFIERAKKLNIYTPNQSGKGMTKKKPKHLKISLEEILEGNHPQYQTNKLKIRLLQEGVIENKCNCCGITEWADKPLILQLDHIDGVGHNHKIENLRLLCPNCHSQTPTFGGRNKRLNNLK